MIVEKFSKNLVASGIFDTYVAAVFFGSTIFFVLNASLFTPLEMMFGVVIATIAFKGFANIMLSMTISLVPLDNVQDKLEFKNASDKLDTLVNDMAIKEAAVQSNKVNQDK